MFRLRIDLFGNYTQTVATLLTNVAGTSEEHSKTTTTTTTKTAAAALDEVNNDSIDIDNFRYT